MTSTSIKPINTLEQQHANNSKLESSMIQEETSEKKPLINLDNTQASAKNLPSESSDTMDNEPANAYRNPDALESFADFYSRKRPSKKLKHKK